MTNKTKRQKKTMINIKELSIGNWVNYRPGWKDEETGQIVYESGTGFPVKIEMIYFCHGEGLVQYNDGQNDGIEACDYELFPIEITPEILEKNGFEYHAFMSDYPADYVLAEDYYSIIVNEVTDGLYQFKIVGEEIINTTEIIHASYVHQLQNALTLCGINKEIEL